MNPPQVYLRSPSWTFLPPPSPTSLWVVPVHHPQASSTVHRTWTGDSFHTWYYTCFNVILPNLPTLSLSHRVQKNDLYIGLFCCLVHRVIVTIFLNSILFLIIAYKIKYFYYNKCGLYHGELHGTLLNRKNDQSISQISLCQESVYPALLHYI